MQARKSMRQRPQEWQYPSRTGLDLAITSGAFIMPHVNQAPEIVAVLFFEVSCDQAAAAGYGTRGCSLSHQKKIPKRKRNW